MIAFGTKFQIPVARQGGREMSAPRPCVTDPFHSLGSIFNITQFLGICKSIPVISSTWYLKVRLGRCVFDNCACALLLRPVFCIDQICDDSRVYKFRIDHDHRCFPCFFFFLFSSSPEISAMFDHFALL